VEVDLEVDFWGEHEVETVIKVRRNKMRKRKDIFLAFFKIFIGA
jgi:hypothetical protein